MNEPVLTAWIIKLIETYGYLIRCESNLSYPASVKQSIHPLLDSDGRAGRLAPGQYCSVLPDDRQCTFTGPLLDREGVPTDITVQAGETGRNK